MTELSVSWHDRDTFLLLSKFDTISFLWGVKNSFTIKLITTLCLIGSTSNSNRVDSEGAAGLLLVSGLLLTFCSTNQMSATVQYYKYRTISTRLMIITEEKCSECSFGL